MGATGEGKNDKEHPEWHPSLLGGTCRKISRIRSDIATVSPGVSLHDKPWSSSTWIQVWHCQSSALTSPPEVKPHTHWPPHGAELKISETAPPARVREASCLRERGAGKKRGPSPGLLTAGGRGTMLTGKFDLQPWFRSY